MKQIKNRMMKTCRYAVSTFRNLRFATILGGEKD